MIWKVVLLSRPVEICIEQASRGRTGWGGGWVTLARQLGRTGEHLQVHFQPQASSASLQPPQQQRRTSSAKTALAGPTTISPAVGGRECVSECKSSKSSHARCQLLGLNISHLAGVRPYLSTLPLQLRNTTFSKEKTQDFRPPPAGAGAPVVTRLRWPPDTPRSMRLPTTVSEQMARSSSRIWGAGQGGQSRGLQRFV